MSINKNILVFYHGNCRDGFTAAWAAWKKLGDSAEYIPIVWSLIPGQIPETKGKTVYFLDITPKDDELSRVVKDSNSVVIIDHHESSKKVVEQMPGSVYDVSHSGAVLAWKYFHPDKKVPELCFFIEDGDLWRWQVPNSDKVLNYIDLIGKLDFETWDAIASDLEEENKRKEYIDKGNLIMSYLEKVIDIIIRDNAQLVSFEGYEVYAVNVPRFFRSEIGMKLAKEKPPFAIVWCNTATDITVSLRSTGFNLVPLAARFNGGGHKTAANFRLPLGSPLPWKKLK